MYLFLPGNNKENKQWCKSLKEAFEGNNQMIYYDHWDSEGNIDWNTELEKIKELDIEEEINIVGKSAGCILGMKAQELGYVKINRYIFIGFPYNWALNRGDDVNPLLSNLTKPSLFIQKPYDPVIGYEELNMLLGGYGLDISMLKYQRSSEVDTNHSYDDIPYLKSVIEAFVN